MISLDRMRVQEEKRTHLHPHARSHLATIPECALSSPKRVCLPDHLRFQCSREKQLEVFVRSAHARPAARVSICQPEPKPMLLHQLLAALDPQSRVRRLHLRSPTLPIVILGQRICSPQLEVPNGLPIRQEATRPCRLTASFHPLVQLVKGTRLCARRGAVAVLTGIRDWRALRGERCCEDSEGFWSRRLFQSTRKAEDLALQLATRVGIYSSQPNSLSSSRVQTRNRLARRQSQCAPGKDGRLITLGPRLQVAAVDTPFFVVGSIVDMLLAKGVKRMSPALPLFDE